MLRVCVREMALKFVTLSDVLTSFTPQTLPPVAARAVDVFVTELFWT
jgi:hypothetical protein